MNGIHEIVDSIDKFETAVDCWMDSKEKASCLREK